MWEHPDLIPTSKDLDDPQGFSKRRELLDASDSDVDAALQRLLDGGFDTPEETAADETAAGGDDSTDSDGESDGSEDSDGGTSKP